MNYRAFNIVAVVTMIAFFAAIVTFSSMNDGSQGRPVANASPISAGDSENKPSLKSRPWQSSLESLNLKSQQGEPVEADSCDAASVTVDPYDTAVYTNAGGTAQRLDSLEQLAELTNTASPSQTSSSASTSPSPGSISGSGGSSTGSSGSSGSSGGTTGASGGSSGSGGSTSSTGGATTTGSGAGTPDLVSLTKPHNITAFFLDLGELQSRGRRLPLSAAMENLGRYDAFWAAATIADAYPDAWRTLRDEYPDKLALYYVSLFTVRPNAPASYLNIDYIEKYHPEWFLLIDEKNATAQDYQNRDKRIRWNPTDPTDWRYNRFFLDVGNPSFQDWAANEFLRKLDPVTGVNARIRYSGLGGDNGLFYSWASGKTKLYPNWKYPDDTGSSWTRAFISYLKVLHDALETHGYKLVVNATIGYMNDIEDQNNFREAVDGQLKEWGVRYSAGLYGSPYWEQIVQYHEDNLAKGLYDWWSFDDFEDYNKLNFTRQDHFLYEYCSFLLIKDSDLSLYGILETTLDWPEEFSLPLGDPVGVRYQKDGCWTRDYRYGKVVVNPSSKRCIFSVDSRTYMLDWKTKKQVIQITLEPLSATILLPTGYSIN